MKLIFNLPKVLKNRKIDGKQVVVKDTIAPLMNNWRKNHEWRLHDWFITAKLNTPLPIDESLDESVYETQVLTSVEEAIKEQTIDRPPSLDELEVLSDDETFEVKIEDTTDDDFSFDMSAHLIAQTPTPPPLSILPVLSYTIEPVEEPQETLIDMGVPSIIESPKNSSDIVDTEVIEGVLSIVDEQSPPPSPENEILTAETTILPVQSFTIEPY